MITKDCTMKNWIKRLWCKWFHQRKHWIYWDGPVCNCALCLWCENEWVEVGDKWI